MGLHTADAVLDEALAVLASSTRLTVCSEEPADFAGIAGVALASATLTPGDGNSFAISDGDVSGRKVRVAAQTGVEVDASGTASHVALDDGATLLHVTTCTPVAIYGAGRVSVPAWDVEFGDPQAETAPVSLTVADMGHALGLEEPSLVQGHVLGVDDMSHAHTVDAPTFGAALDFFVDWRTATGQTDAAYLDGGKLTGYVGDPDFIPDPTPGENKENREYGRVIAAPSGFPAGMTNVFQYEIPDFRAPDAQPGLQVVAKDLWTMPAVGEYQFTRWYGMLDAPDGHNPADQHFFHMGKDGEGDAYESTFWLNAQESDGLFITGGRYRVTLVVNWQSSSMGSRLGYLNVLLDVGTAYEFQLRQHRVGSLELRYSLRVWEVGGSELTGGDFIWEEYDDPANPASLEDFAVNIGDAASHFQVHEIGYNGSSPTGTFTPVPKHNIGGVAVLVTNDGDAWIPSYPVAGVED